jgi:hypothetical protein
MLSKDTSTLIDYKEEHHNETGNIADEDLRDNRRMLKGMLRAKLNTAGTTVDDIKELDYCQMLYRDSGLEESIMHFYTMIHTDIELVEEPEHVLGYVKGYVNIYDRSCSGDLHKACRYISKEHPQAVKDAMILKAIVNGD